MIKYIVLLNQTALGIASAEYPLPDEFLQYLDDITGFSSREEAYEYINSRYSFDDIWEFGAYYDLRDGKVYHRLPK